MTRRSCLSFGSHRCANLVSNASGRCPGCQAAVERARGTTAQRGYGARWQRHSKQAIAAHLAEYGSICPGWKTASHLAGRFVTDHDVGVLCVVCNARKAATTDKQRRRRP